MSEFLGYARVSTAEQTAALQEDALRAAGCQRIWSDTASGTRTDRPQLVAVFDQLRVGDTLVVWRLDRLGRSLPHLIETIGELQARGVGFKSVQESIDTTTPGGRLVFHVFGALASFERELIQERTLAGLARRSGAWPPRRAAHCVEPGQAEAGPEDDRREDPGDRGRPGPRGQPGHSVPQGARARRGTTPRVSVQCPRRRVHFLGASVNGGQYTSDWATQRAGEPTPAWARRR